MEWPRDMANDNRRMRKDLEEAHARIEQLEAENRATIAAIIGTIGGEVEGHPTSSINYLQRLRAMLARIEQLEAAGRETVSALITLGEDGWSEAPYLLRLWQAALAGKEGT